MPNRGTTAVLLIQLHHNVKKFWDEEPSKLLKNVKKPAQ